MTSPAVLVVDDDFLVRMNTADILQDAGFDVLEAGDAADALALLHKWPCIKLICTDVQMPGGMDGIDLVLRIQVLHPEMRVIIMSGDGKHSNRLPSVPFLRKPFHITSLVDLAREELGATRSSVRSSQAA